MESLILVLKYGPLVFLPVYLLSLCAFLGCCAYYWVRDEDVLETVLWKRTVGLGPYSHSPEDGFSFWVIAFLLGAGLSFIWPITLTCAFITGILHSLRGFIRLKKKVNKMGEI